MQRASRYLVALGSYRAHLTACLALFACLALADTAGAVPPVPADCDAVVDSGERIQCKYGNIVEQQLETAAMLANLPDLPQSQQQALMNQANRAEIARSRASPIDFQQLTRKTESTCQVVELLIGLASKKWRAPTETGGVRWDEGSGLRRSSSARRCAWL